MLQVQLYWPTDHLNTALAVCNYEQAHLTTSPNTDVFLYHKLDAT